MSAIDQLKELIARVDAQIISNPPSLLLGLLEAFRAVLSGILYLLYVQEISCIIWPNPPEEINVVFAPTKLVENDEIVTLSNEELLDVYELLRECLPAGVENCVDGLEIKLGILFAKLDTEEGNIVAKPALQQSLWRRLIWAINNTEPNSIKARFKTFYQAAYIIEDTQIDKLLSSSEEETDGVELPAFGTLGPVENVPTLLFIARLMEIEDIEAENLTLSELEEGERIGIKSLLQYLYSIEQLNEDLIRNLLESYEAKIENALGLNIDDEVNIGNIQEQIVRNNQLLLEYLGKIGNNTIYSVIDSFRFRHNYRMGAETMAKWLTSYFNISLPSQSLSAMYDNFLFVMNSIQINRTADSFAGVADSFGYTQDHIIHDRLGGFTNSNFRASRKPIKWQLFLHELCHAFINSGGFGAVGTSPLFGGSGTTNDMSSTMYTQMENGIVRCSGTTGLCEDFGNEASGTAGTEIVANYIQSAALGLLIIHPNHGEKFTHTMVANVLRNTDPSDVAQAIATGIGAGSPVSEDVVIGNEVILRLDPNQVTPLPSPVPTASTITLLAKHTIAATSVVWYYCAALRTNLEVFDYGWVSASSLPTPTTTLPALNSFTITSFSVLNGQLLFTSPS